MKIHPVSPFFKPVLFFFLTIAELSAQTKPVTLNGSISGLIAGSAIVLGNQDEEPVTIKANGAFKIPVTSLNNYNITIHTQPEGLRCIIANNTGNGTKPVAITCPLAVVNSLVWMRCTHGQKWNDKAGNCTGSGKANSFGAISLQYCDKKDNSCNGGTSEGLVQSGPLFDACNQLNAGEGAFGVKSWRVPEKNELKSLVVCTDGTATPLKDYGTDPYKCGLKNNNYTNGTWKAPALRNDLFPNTVSLEYWTASSDKNQSAAWYTAFQNGWTHMATKTGHSFVRCVSSP